MIPGWMDKIAEAQTESRESLNGTVYARLPYGTENNGDVPSWCKDCAVAVGMLHVGGCCVERCARCQGQRISCLCVPDAGYDDEPTLLQ